MYDDIGHLGFMILIARSHMVLKREAMPGRMEKTSFEHMHGVDTSFLK
jgi:hypothetical protein